MTTPSPRAASQRALPPRPNLKHLKDEAKARHRLQRQNEPQAKLADAQFRIAREYGFASWRALKAEVDRRAAATPEETSPLRRYVGAYRYDPALVSHGVLEFAEHDANLFIVMPEGASLALVDQSDGLFSQPGMARRLQFVGEPARPAQAVVLHDERGSVRLERIDADAALQAKAAIAAARAEQARPRAAIVITAAALAPFVGHYSTRLGPVIEITQDGARLFARVSGQPKLELFPEAPTDFFYRVVPAQLCFVMQGEGAVAAILHQNGQARRLERVSPEAARRAGAIAEQKADQQLQPRTPVKIDAAVLAGYVGRYRVDAARTLLVTAEHDRLFIEITDQQRLPVYPESERDFFWTAAAAQISFITDAAGRAVSAVLHQSGQDTPLARIDPPADPGARHLHTQAQGA